MPPPMITKVMPMLTTPMIEAKRMIVRMLSGFTKRPCAVSAPIAEQHKQRDDEAEVAPGAAAEEPGERAALLGCALRDSGGRCGRQRLGGGGD